MCGMLDAEGARGIAAHVRVRTRCVLPGNAKGHAQCAGSRMWQHSWAEGRMPPVRCVPRRTCVG